MSMGKVFATFAAVLLPWASNACAGWQVTDLGHLGGSVSEAASINELGMVVGKSKGVDGKFHAFLWYKGKMIDLGLQGDASYAVAVNRRSDVIGNNVKANKTRGFIWRKGEMADLGTLGGEETVAVGINDAGEVVGISRNSWGDQSFFYWKNGKMTEIAPVGFSISVLTYAPLTINDKGQVTGVTSTGLFRWHNGRIDYASDPPLLDFGHLEGHWTGVSAINDKGDIAGTAYYMYRQARPFIWQKGNLTPFYNRDIPCGNDAQYATLLNNRGQVAGYTITSAPVPKAFFWDKGQTFCIGGLGDDYNSMPIAMNASGDVVGYSYKLKNSFSDGPHHAFIWKNGVITPLPSPFGEESAPAAVNDKGQVVGTNNGHAVLWTK